jgi:hypothetical protein
MIFGNHKTLAIEVGALVEDNSSRLWVPFKFIIANIEFGDFEGDLGTIPLDGCAGYLNEFLQNCVYRRDVSMKDVSAEEVFERLFTRYYEEGSFGTERLFPSLRDSHHLSDVGMEAVIDKCAILMVEVAQNTSRIVVKDHRVQQFVVDMLMPTSEFEAMAEEFLRWARLQGWEPYVYAKRSRKTRRPPDA